MSWFGSLNAGPASDFFNDIINWFLLGSLIMVIAYSFYVQGRIENRKRRHLVRKLHNMWLGIRLKAVVDLEADVKEQISQKAFKQMLYDLNKDLNRIEEKQ